MRTLLVTNDFPPKVGGIQSYLGELWDRLDPTTTSVLTASSDAGAADHDAACLARGLLVERTGARTLYVPTRGVRRAIDAAVARHRPDLVLYDPFVPLGNAGARGGTPYGVVLHGAEVAIPGRLPGVASIGRAVLRGATAVVCAGGYPEAEARRLHGQLRGVVQVPPGVDVNRFVPCSPGVRAQRRASLGVPEDGHLIVSVGRLVPRKGIDVLVGAVQLLSRSLPNVVLAIAGAGRDERRLRRLATSAGNRIRFLGRVDDQTKVELLGAADVFVQPCRSRWLGFEQEGFGIVFLEAAACGTPAIAGRSGGSFEAVEHGVTGLVVDEPGEPQAVARALHELLGDRAACAAMGTAARARAEASFDYDVLARQLAAGLDRAVAAPMGHPDRTPRRH